MPKQFYGHGKLLISGEYAVLDGALAWAMPTKFGQHLRVFENDSEKITWKSLDEKGHPWFTAVFEQGSLIEISNSDTNTSNTLQKLLIEAQRLNPDFLNTSNGYTIETELTFPRDWGLGSSSTLISTIAQWAQIDPFQLLWNAFSGSGYDIACATHNTPISYQLKNGAPIIKELTKPPTFLNSTHFVHLNKKRNSRHAIDAYRKREIAKAVLVKDISSLTLEMIACSTIERFERLIQTHEGLLSDALGIPTIQEELFADYQGHIKSLGAWGGDFVLVTGLEKSPDYFEKKGYQVVVPFQQMIL